MQFEAPWQRRNGCCEKGGFSPILLSSLNHSHIRPTWPDRSVRLCDAPDAFEHCLCRRVSSAPSHKNPIAIVPLSLIPNGRLSQVAVSFPAASNLPSPCARCRDSTTDYLEYRSMKPIGTIWNQAVGVREAFPLRVSITEPGSVGSSATSGQEPPSSRKTAFTQARTFRFSA
ncbi:MAG: hypothetical protein ACD_10C00408G0005 [uncultured bacterium]|nr:MAG: hypothetical protein ACD_10C00408G0005 [uncultured bacterium]